MLISIECSKFRREKISFREGLNVVLGDEDATNSIGKSTLLMVIDFAFGGGSLLEHNTDLVAELGHHSYKFTFAFDGGNYTFKRSTDQPDVVFACDGDGGYERPMSLEKYCAFLQASYGATREDMSFRSLVGLYFRVWGKENIDVHKPLHVAKAQPPKDCVNNLIKTYDMFSPIRNLAEELAVKEKEKSALRAAFGARLLQKVGKREYIKNEQHIEEIELEIQDIKANLAKYAANINLLVNRKMLELKTRRDELLELRTQLQNRLLRTERNIAENRHIKSAHFAGVAEYFPEVDKDRLAAIEEFHDGLAKLLRRELLDAQKGLQTQLSEVDQRLEEIDGEMAKSLSSVAQPSEIVDRVYELSDRWGQAKQQNEFYERAEGLKSEVQSLSDAITTKKLEALASIQTKINTGLERLVESVFGRGKKSPTIFLSESNYRYEVFEDTGTGTAFSALVMFDLTVFLTTVLPCIAHDSLLFKNIENESVARLLAVYESCQKQSFIAIDEARKYGDETFRLLTTKAVIQLSDAEVLYVKDWRSRRLN